MAIPTDVEGTWFNDATVSLDAGELRRADGAMFAGDGTTSTGARGGIVRHADTSLGVTVDGSDVVTVQPGAVVVPGNAASGTGVYRLALSGAITGSLTARNATNPRITLVIFRALDDDVVGTHNAFKGRVEFVDGTPAGSPSAPSLPTMAVELARITVPNTGGGAASVDSTFRTYATAIGGELIVPTAARLPAASPLYQMARTLDTGFRHRFNGSTWDAIDTAWTTLATNLTTGGIRYRRQGDEVWLHIDGSFNTTSGVTSGNLNSSAIPAAFRPTPPIGSSYRLPGYFGGYPGHVFVDTSGNITSFQISGGSRASVNMTQKYPLG